ncbi:MAG: DUF4838 domain-containing protein [Bacteroidota bacterium]|nr:DUF4838 domain-containing protein [Bacteroidota bacterium]
MKKVFVLFCFILSMFISGIACANGEQIDLMQLKDWLIILDKDAIPSEKFAAEEFQNLFAKTTGINLRIGYKPISENNNIFLGYSESMKKSNVGFDITELKEEGLRINIKTNNIAIAGGRPRGTLYGVYEFAERYMGIRFLTYDHTYIPSKKENILVNTEDYKYVPPFTFRSSYYFENIKHPEFSVRLFNNSFATDTKYGGKSAMDFVSHSLFRQVPTEKYSKKHPEYFAEIGGKRLLSAYGGGPQVCNTNQDVVNIVTESVLKEIKDRPGVKDIAVVQNDNQYYCTCPKCEAINKKEESPMGSHLTLVNEVADRVAKQYPDVIIGTLAYQYTRKAPKTIVPRDNVMVQLCSIECNLLRPVNDKNDDMNRPFAEDLAAWGKICKNLWIWDYMVDYRSYTMPFPNLKAIGQNIKYYADNNIKGVFMEANYQSDAGEMSDLRNYVTSHCLWKPGSDSWALAEEFCRLHYGKAWKPIFEYLTMFHDNAEKLNLKAKFNAVPEEVGLNKEMSEKILNYFEEALKLADNDEIKDRVEKASISALCTMIETARGDAKFENGRYNYQSDEKYKDCMRRYIELAHKFNMINYNEDDFPFTKNQELEFKRELKIYDEGGRPAAQLENDIWKLTLLTDEDGKIVEMIHKPSGYNFLPAGKYDLKTAFLSDIISSKVYKDSIPSHFGVENIGNSVILTKYLKDGSEYKKTIILAEDGSGKILFNTTINQKGKFFKRGNYKLIVEPNFETGTRSRKSGAITAFVKIDNQWKPFSEGLIGNHGPYEKLIDQGRIGGVYALFNSQKKIGLIEKFESKKVDGMIASWTDSSSKFKLGFTTKDFKIRKNSKYSFDYSIEFIDHSPEK